MKKITPHLWFDKEAKGAAKLYTSLLPNSKVTGTTTLHDTPSGDCDVVSFELAGQPFMAISAGPLFKFNPSVSFHVVCRTAGEVDELWKKLSDGGTVLMELGEYPFSKRFGWVQDRYGLSWQPILIESADAAQRITPVLMFVGKVCGKAEEAINFYVSVFRGPFAAGHGTSEIREIHRYGKGQSPEREGTAQ